MTAEWPGWRAHTPKPKSCELRDRDTRLVGPRIRWNRLRPTIHALFGGRSGTATRCCPTFPFVVMPGLVPGIHALRQRVMRGSRRAGGGTWMPGTSPGMTEGSRQSFGHKQEKQNVDGRANPTAVGFRFSARVPRRWTRTSPPRRVTPDLIRGDGGDNAGRCGRPPAPAPRRGRGGDGHASVPRRSPVSGRMARGGGGGSVSSAAASALEMAARVSGVPGRLPISICDR